jgi:heme-degrading monooxygenase HmoA
MKAGVVHYKFKDGKMEEAVDRWKEAVISQARKQKGYKGVMLLLDPSGNRGFDIGFWENEQDCIHYEESGLFQLLARDMEDLLVEKPSREKYDIAFRE